MSVIPQARPEEASAAEARRCRRRQRAQGALRPTDVIGAFFLLGLGFLAAAAVAACVDAIEPWSRGRWLALHLAFVGGVSQLVLGASQFFSGAFLAVDPPSRTLVRAQLAAWNLGAVLLAIAIPAGSDPLVDAAVALLLGGLALYGAGLRRMRRASLRFAPWASRWYLAAAAFLAAGTVGGALLGRGVAWTHGDLLAAHMALNLGGWFGTAIVGTLHTFFPSLASSELRLPRLQGPTFVAWTVGIAALAVGYAWSVAGLAEAGWIVLVLAAALLVTNLAATAARAPWPPALPALLLGVAQPFLLAGVCVAALAALADGPSLALAGDSRAAVAALLVGGWIALTVLGSLLHLLAVVGRVRDFSRSLPVPQPSRDLPLVAAAAAGAVALALSYSPGAEALREPAALLLGLAYAVLALKVARLGAVLLRDARPSV